MQQLGLPYNVDYFGITKPQGVGWDIGAFEYQGVSGCHLADKDNSNSIEIEELITFIGEWKNNQATIQDVIEVIGLWKSGC